MSTHKIKIAARLRPRLENELTDEQIRVVHSSDSSSSSASSSSSNAGSYIAVTNPRDPSQIFKFPFSSCYDESTSQEEIFRTDVEPLLDVVFSGVTVTIFAYGVTSSGKTHTMQGTKTDPGVIPRVVQAMFAKAPTLTSYTTTLSISYMEIYKDEVYDLLVARETAPKLPVRENDAGEVFVANLSSIPIESYEEFDGVYTQATRNRSTGATNLNRTSSRSHAVLTVEAKMVDLSGGTTLTGKINLVDLAGSENNKQTGNDSTRMAESAAINKSLSVLGQVVHALNQGAPRIPYRNSRLTRILQDALGGNSVALLICNLAPGTKFRQDTLNTLNFAVRTKNVENRPVVNERDNRPPPKQHFSAPTTTQTSTKPASAAVVQQAIGGPSNAGRARLSLAPNPHHGPTSRVPRASLAPSLSGGNFQSFAGLGRRLTSVHERSSFGGAPVPAPQPQPTGLTAEEIDQRISKAVEQAVEQEVARRLAEREKEWQEEQRRLQNVIAEQSAAASRRDSRSRTPEYERENSRDVGDNSREGGASLPSGVLTPLLKKHRDLDQELKERLQELERKFEQGNKETQLADVLSPISKKKTGRAYVALARAHSEKGDLSVALDLYRKASTYVPDNIKLKERIIEIEWAVKNNQPFVPSPKPTRKQKHTRAKSKSKLRHSENADEEGMNVDGLDSHHPHHEEDEETDGLELKKGKDADIYEHAEFGVELTNGKRSFADTEQVGVVSEAQTPMKRQRIQDVFGGEYGA